MRNIDPMTEYKMAEGGEPLVPKKVMDEFYKVQDAEEQCRVMEAEIKELKHRLNVSEEQHKAAMFGQTDLVNDIVRKDRQIDGLCEAIRVLTQR